jgi:hypothetical protein
MDLSFSPLSIGSAEQCAQIKLLRVHGKVAFRRARPF